MFRTLDDGQHKIRKAAVDDEISNALLAESTMRKHRIAARGTRTLKARRG